MNRLSALILILFVCFIPACMPAPAKYTELEFGVLDVEDSQSILIQVDHGEVIVLGTEEQQAQVKGQVLFVDEFHFVRHITQFHDAGLVGGGNIPKLGKISLAHRGVLFLNEFPEFGTRVLEVMHQPMEDKVVTISRAKGSLTFSTNFQLIAAMNPCPCGYYGDSLKPCTCAPVVVTKYQ